jgi:hypothetical protein
MPHSKSLILRGVASEMPPNRPHNAECETLCCRYGHKGVGGPWTRRLMRVQGSLTAAPNQSILVRTGSSPDLESQSDPADLSE